MSDPAGPRRRGRPPLVGRREEILDAAVTVLADRGVESLSMTALAAELGFSSYALTYHFGTREQVLAAVVDHVEQRVRADVAAAAGGSPATAGELLQRYWAAVRSAPGGSAATRLWLEFVLLASRDPDRFPNFVDRAVVGWRDTVRAALGGRPDATELATLSLASVIGLEVLQIARPASSAPGRALDALAAVLDSGVSRA